MLTVQVHVIADLAPAKLFQNHVDRWLFQANITALLDHVWLPATIHALPVISLEA
jgi:hypothetical protein